MLMRPALPITDQPLPLQQAPEFARALTQLGRRAAIDVLHDAGQVLVVSRRVRGFGDLRFASRGPVFQGHASHEDRIAALRGARLHLVNAAACDAGLMRAAGFWQVMTPAHVALLPLDPDPDTLLARAHGKWRNAARAGLRGMAGSRVRVRQRPFCARRDGWLLAADAAQQADKGFRALPHAVSLAYARANPDDALMVTASEGAVPVAAMLILRHGAAATYQIGWSGARGRTLHAHHVMLLETASRLAKAGVSMLDLGLVNTVSAPGLARFKIGCGADICRLNGTWMRRPDWPFAPGC